MTSMSNFGTLVFKKIMKKIILLFTILFINVVFSQRKNIYVEYSVKIFDEQILVDSPPEFRKSFLEAMASADNLSFGLIINSSASKFYYKPSLFTSNANNMSSKLFTGYSGVVFQYSDNVYSESNSLGKDIMVKKTLKDNWNFHNDTKIIDGYLCYKATNVNSVDNGTGKIFNHPVIAWFCPKLPYSFGPNGYSNLPGLILELQVRNVVFGAKKIDLESNLNFDTEFLKTVKTISEQDLNKKIDEEFEELRKQYGK